MTWGTALTGWPSRTVFQQPARPNRSPRSDNVRAANGWPGELQANTGLRWTQRNTPVDQSFVSICWAPELRLFCAASVTGTNNRFITSPNGVDWTARTPPDPTRAYRAICWSPELRLFCAVCNNGTGSRVATSPNGVDWTLQATPADYAWQVIAWSPQLRLFCAFEGAAASAFCMTSPDGAAWTLRSIPVAADYRGLTWAPELGIFCVISATYQVSLTSSNGTSWTQSSFDPLGTVNFADLAWSSTLRLFVAASSSGGSPGGLLYSRNGSTWIVGPTLPAGGSNIVAIPGIGFSLNSSVRAWLLSNGLDWATPTGSVASNSTSLVIDASGGFAACWSPELRMLCACRTSGTGNRIATSP